ncbi:MAG: hypothetical protein U0R26_10400 [Solirubrobacterales bacterium]
MRRILAPVFLALMMLSVIAPSALATRAEEQQGAALMHEFQAGEQSCASLTSKQFELIGEYIMARMIGNPAAHDAMNARMKQMMGPRGEAEAHIFLAQSNLGCTNGAGPPTSFGRMMGMVGAYRGGRGMGSGMMGGSNGGAGESAGNYSGGSGMMGENHHNAGWGTGTIVLVVLLGGALVAALTVGAMKLARRP